MSWKAFKPLNMRASEQTRLIEETVRQLVCRVCDAPPRHGCLYPGWMSDGQSYAHTLRYQDAADGGLVPPMPGGFRVRLAV